MLVPLSAIYFTAAEVLFKEIYYYLNWLQFEFELTIFFYLFFLVSSTLALVFTIEGSSILRMF